MVVCGGEVGVLGGVCRGGEGAVELCEEWALVGGERGLFLVIEGGREDVRREARGRGGAEGYGARN